MEHIKRLHIIGYKNSGKTTLVSRWIRLLKEQGLCVVGLKQHRHNGQLKMPDEQTDSMQFFLNGADSSIIAGGGTVQMMLHENPDFTRLIELAHQSKPDVILAEGFKEQQGDKVILLREEADWEQLQGLEDIQLVVGCSNLTIEYNHIHDRTDEKELDEWLLTWVGS
ncbi:molybdopterin-guanine dinucleotide biosynthesis protein B [Virgibacillus soli]|uniref:Molybdopterin-guanine dinucleotide biosynthesis protein B n=1 Tax=Paracerasibacillus soli TaxID=480284 RepID=A0ABU5CRX1_9BACI|nr:molybdopterin-guanine dinucleotide biosynthesis protein B [Virgibacillus soli]MDY0409113.1 molybdopterin-guanine dinucleotide biosynthesis protein B [Virgibacillus soli]